MTPREVHTRKEIWVNDTVTGNVLVFALPSEVSVESLEHLVKRGLLGVGHVACVALERLGIERCVGPSVSYQLMRTTASKTIRKADSELGCIY
jgi:hypothetical protein